MHINQSIIKRDIQQYNRNHPLD